MLEAEISETGNQVVRNLVREWVDAAEGVLVIETKDIADKAAVDCSCYGYFGWKKIFRH